MKDILYHMGYHYHLIAEHSAHTLSSLEHKLSEHAPFLSVVIRSVVPSYHEGLPISLLEAMSYNIDVVVSDIPANKLPELDSADFFRCGEMDSLTKVLNQKEKNLVQERVYDLTNYDWNHIAEQTIAVYKKAMRK